MKIRVTNGNDVQILTVPDDFDVDAGRPFRALSQDGETVDVHFHKNMEIEEICPGDEYSDSLGDAWTGGFAENH